jgi:hypothetical protein
MMNEKFDEETKSYVDLASQSYAMIVDAFATAQQRSLGFGKSVYEVLTRPYASTAMETTYRENFDRANQIVELTVSEMQQAGTAAAKLGQALVSHNALWQEKTMESARGLMKTMISNMNYVKDTTDKQFEGFTKRVEEMQARTVSAN